jgi:hypothetical protein
MRDDVISGRAWEQFCDSLKRAGTQVLRPEAPASELDRAEGYRYLTRLLRLGLEMHLEYADPDFPGFFAPSHETAKIGADNPDNLYLMARLNGRHEYVVRGERGTAPYLSFGTPRGGYESNGRMEQTGFLDGADLQVDADGRFEVVLGARRRPGNWVALAPDSNALIVRQTFLDRAREQPARLSIARLDAGERPHGRSRCRPSGSGAACATPRPSSTAPRGCSRTGPPATGSTRTRCRPPTRRCARASAATRTSTTTTRTGSSRPTRPCWSASRASRSAASGTCRSTITGWSRSTTGTIASA